MKSLALLGIILSGIVPWSSGFFLKMSLFVTDLSLIVG